MILFVNILKFCNRKVVLVLGVVPGLIALGIFAKSAHNKTGSANFLSKEALKTSEATELKKYMEKI